MKIKLIKGLNPGRSLMLLGIGCVFSYQMNAQTLKLHYAFSNISTSEITDESGNGYNGELKGSAYLTSFDNHNVVDLGNSSGYVDMGTKCGEIISSLSDFTIHTKVYVPNSTNLSGNGFFIWTFSNAENIASNPVGNMFFTAKTNRFAITPTNYSAESELNQGSALSKDVWNYLTVTRNGNQTKLFVNGELVKSSNITLSPSSLGSTPYNWIGRPCYKDDNYLKDAKIADFAIYDGALSDTQVGELAGIKKEETTLVYNADFSSLTDIKAGIKGSLENGAVLTEEEGIPVLSLGDDNGYFNMGKEVGDIISSLENFSISTNLYIPSSYTLGSNGNFIYTFANSTNSVSDRNGYLFFSANSSKYAITKTYYSSEQYLNGAKAIETGVWKNVTVTQSNGLVKIYVDGEILSSKSITLTPSDLGSTSYNLLGRSCYSGDVYLKGARYNDFRIYEGALSGDDVAELCKNLKSLNIGIYRSELEEMAKTLVIPSILHANLTLPVKYNNIDIVWSSSNESLLSNKGIVVRPAIGGKDETVVLSALFSKDGVSVTKTYEITVPVHLNDLQSVKYDINNIVLDNSNPLITSIKLPYSGSEGSVISWKSGSTEYITNEGKVVKLSENGNGLLEVEMIATVTKGDISESKSFKVYIAEDEGYSCYLFAYFTGNSAYQEQIRFALTMDGYNYTPLNDGDPVISSSDIALKESVRDPHILRGEDGYYYMVVTDMRSSQGWSSNDGLVLLRSADLIDWTHQTIDFPDTWPARFDRDNLTQVWAPQTIYDPEEGKYMVYYSIGEKNAPYYKIYYSYANEDFTSLSMPEVLYDHGANTIDADIVYHDGLYHMFYKTEGEGNGIQKSTATTLRGEWTPQYKYLQQTNVAVEGSGLFKLINSDKWILMYDCYTSGHYQFCSSSDLDNFEFICNTTTSGVFTPRHGTTLAITKEEAQRLYNKWPGSMFNNIPLGAKATEVRQDLVVINNTEKTIFIPVVQGTDISSFDPQLYGFGEIAEVLPAGKTDFSKGAVDYTFKLGNSTVTYRVTVSVCANPVISGFYADPEIMYSNKTNRFYIYPTTDGFSGWGGYKFNVFSSNNMVDWIDEGTILDLSTDQVSWAIGNAWAPCIEEKIVDGNYKYFFYFSGNAGSSKQIGVAVADEPTGPFFDIGAPIITTSPTGSGQQIDVDVFTDPVSGKSYIYWGNSYLAGAELNDDMVTLKESTTKVMTPQGGTLSDYAYREAPYVFFRDGKYYFMWSVDDTGSANYHVAYGTSDSPLGEITVATEPIVLVQDPDKAIYGPGHNSVIKIPGKDEWYIVYHRINKNYIDNSPGVHREVCIDKLEFNADGTIKRVVPTNEGISPVVLNEYIDTYIENIIIDNGSKGEIVKIEYFTLDGIFIGTSCNQLAKGIYIVRNIYSDGSVSSSKIVK